MGLGSILLVAFSIAVIIGGMIAGSIASKKVQQMEKAEMEKKQQK